MTASQCSQWRAIHNWQPPHPGALVVMGICTMPTPGYRVTLKRHVPQGINPLILLLDREATPPDGFVPQIITPAAVFYREITQEKYTQVTILPDNTTIDVADVH